MEKQQIRLNKLKKLEDSKSGCQIVFSKAGGLLAVSLAYNGLVRRLEAI